MDANKGCVEGRVEEELAGGLYRVKIAETDKEVLCYLAGKMKMNHIRVLIGDKVLVLLDKYGGRATNRITRRK